MRLMNNKNVDIATPSTNTVEILADGVPIFSAKTSDWKKYEIYDQKYEPAGLILEFTTLFGKKLLRYFTKTSDTGHTCVSINTALNAMKLTESRKSYYRKEICGGEK